MITFTVRGLPAPQGSKRVMPSGRPGGKVHVVESSKKVQPWRVDVRAAALEAHGGSALGGPIGLELAFRLPRPKGHYLPVNSKRSEPELAASAPIAPAGVPDLDKLARAVLDACTGVVWKDDGQVVDLVLTKRYDDFAPAGVDVRVREL